MTWNDPIVEEVRKIRQEYAARFNFDLDAIYRDLKAREVASDRTYVDLSLSRQKRVEAKQKDQPRP